MNISKKQVVQPTPTWREAEHSQPPGPPMSCLPALKGMASSDGWSVDNSCYPTVQRRTHWCAHIVSGWCCVGVQWEMGGAVSVAADHAGSLLCSLPFCAFMVLWMWLKATGHQEECYREDSSACTYGHLLIRKKEKWRGKGEIKNQLKLEK